MQTLYPKSQILLAPGSARGFVGFQSSPSPVTENLCHEVLSPNWEKQMNWFPALREFFTELHLDSLRSRLRSASTLFAGISAPYYTDNLMHNLKAERFFKTKKILGRTATADGPNKTFLLRGIKDSPLYLHDGRC